MIATPRTVLWPLVRALAYTVGLWYLAKVVYLQTEVADGWALFGEDGVLERLQVGFLVLHGLLALALAWRRPITRPLAILLVGLAVSGIVREHNNWFKDTIGQNVWQAVVGVVLVAAVGIAWRLRGDLWAALGDLVSRPAFGWIAACGAVFLYGQILDQLVIWQLLLGDAPPYAAQRMAEESTETAAYALAACGLFEWWLTAPRAAPDAAA